MTQGRDQPFSVVLLPQAAAQQEADTGGQDVRGYEQKGSTVSPPSLFPPLHNLLEYTGLWGRFLSRAWPLSPRRRMPRVAKQTVTVP